MRFRVLMSLLAFVLCLLPSHAKAAEQLQTAWIGEHEAFLVWYAKQKGWDKDAGLDIRMLRFGSGDKIVSRQGDYQWKIAGCGAVPTLMAASKGQFYVVGIGNVINGMKSSGKKRDNLGSIGKDFRWECNSIAESATKKEGNQPSFFVV